MTDSKFAKLVAAIALAALFAPGAALAGDAAAGKQTFNMFCSSCHGATGKGDGPVGAVLNPPPRDLAKGEFKFDTDGDGKTGTDADLMNVISNGAGKYGGSQQMAPWGGSLSEADRQNVIAFIRALKP
ncbi:MAG: cytochrome c [Myxococcales bacterium]|nr:cytochrome c [Myxococcales bacterium]MDH5307166.1 cytochrome c [Myxococcales bacterium]MDH5566482.1 cytochrome c [Myxococcales bacterium]